MTDDDLKRLLDLAAKATPDYCHNNTHDNIRFIAATSPATVTSLVAEVLRLRAELSGVKVVQ